MEFKMQFKTQFKISRIKAGHNQEQAAKAMRLSRSAVQALEQKGIEPVSPLHMKAIEDYITKYDI